MKVFRLDVSNRVEFSKEALRVISLQGFLLPKIMLA